MLLEINPLLLSQTVAVWFLTWSQNVHSINGKPVRHTLTPNTVTTFSLWTLIYGHTFKPDVDSEPTKLLNPHQSAYCKHHSTETALLYIHDHLINAIGSQKVSCLWLLDLFAAFDTIDHNILITRLSSWFGIHGSVLSWFKSYLSSRSFLVK